MTNAPASTAPDHRALTVAMGLSLGFGLVMFAIKSSAYVITGSAAILSDAAESVVHVAAVVFATCSLWFSFRPADATHPYGHAKIAFFSAGFEGAMIILAAVYILYVSLQKWILGYTLERVGVGTVLTAVAAVINGVLGGYLVWTGRRRHSLILSANGKHVLTDCWTSLAVLLGLGLVLATGWQGWDPLCGMLMAANILLSGVGLIRAASAGLMDAADPRISRRLRETLDDETQRHGIAYHNLLHRNVGEVQWVEVHLLFDSDVRLAAAHRTATTIEESIAAALGPRTHVTTHLECAEDHDHVHDGPHTTT